MNSQKEIKKAVRRETPKVHYNQTLRTAIREMSVGNSSAVIVVKNDELIGILSDMDIVHAITKGGDIDEIEVAQAMTSCEFHSPTGLRKPLLAGTTP